MTQVTCIENKDEFKSLAGQLGTELISIQGEIDTIKSKLAGVTNYDGMNFQGVASLISSNLTNVITALTTLSDNVDSYIASLDEMDVYEEEPTEDLDSPQLEVPEDPVVPGSGSPVDEDKDDDIPLSGDVPDNEPTVDPEIDPNNNPNGVTGGNPTVQPDGSDIDPNKEQNQEDKPEVNPEDDKMPDGEIDNKPPSGNPSGGSGNRPSPAPQPQPQPQPEPQPEPNPTPEFVPEELVSSGEVVIGVGDPSIDVSHYTNNPELGYVVTTGNMSFELNESDYNLLCAIVAAESDGSYDNTLYVASMVLNRCENSEFSRIYGIDPIAQITANNQFSGYTTGEFQQYLGNTSDIVNQAVRDALAGVRNHSLCTPVGN